MHSLALGISYFTTHIELISVAFLPKYHGPPVLFGQMLNGILPHISCWWVTACATNWLSFGAASFWNEQKGNTHFTGQMYSWSWPHNKVTTHLLAFKWSRQVQVHTNNTEATIHQNLIKQLCFCLVYLPKPNASNVGKWMCCPASAFVALSV